MNCNPKAADEIFAAVLWLVLLAHWAQEAMGQLQLWWQMQRSAASPGRLGKG